MKIIVKIEDKWHRLDLHNDKIGNVVARLASPDSFTSSNQFISVTINNKNYYVSPACIQFLIDED